MTIRLAAPEYRAAKALLFLVEKQYVHIPGTHAAALYDHVQALTERGWTDDDLRSAQSIVVKALAKATTEDDVRALLAIRDAIEAWDKEASR